MKNRLRLVVLIALALFVLTFAAGCEQYPLVNVGVEIEGNGRVLNSGIYNQNAVVVLRAIPDAGSAFVGWFDNEGNELGVGNTYRVKAESNVYVKAVFEITDDGKFELILIASDDSYATLIGEGRYAEGEWVYIDAILADGILFLGWFDDLSGELKSEMPTYSFRMPACNCIMYAELAVMVRPI